ncbi:MAG: hypothetical protein ACOYBJ_01155 [Patescibacteria group bacterium]|jgi:hypothetical protein
MDDQSQRLAALKRAIAGRIAATPERYLRYVRFADSYYQRNEPVIVVAEQWRRFVFIALSKQEDALYLYQSRYTSTARSMRPSWNNKVAYPELWVEFESQIRALFNLIETQEDSHAS